MVAVLQQGEFIAALVRLALGVRTSVSAEQDVARVRAASKTCWQKVLSRLEEHRIVELAARVLQQHPDIEVSVPAEVRAVLGRTATHTRTMNELRWLSLQGIAARLARQGLSALTCKGMVLARQFYPDVGCRPMSDIDLWVQAADFTSAHAVLTGLGYERLTEKSLPDGENYRNSLGINVDLHPRMRLFDALPGGLQSVTRPWLLPGIRVLEPHALLAHLNMHLCGHVPVTGPMLGWFIDIALVLAKFDNDLDLSELESLFPSQDAWLAFVLTATFIDSRLGLRIPAGLERYRTLVPEPPQLDLVLRVRRNALWRLSSLRGWARLAATGLRLTSPNGRKLPGLAELVHSPWDRRCQALRHWHRTGLSPQVSRRDDRSDH